MICPFITIPTMLIRPPKSNVVVAEYHERCNRCSFARTGDACTLMASKPFIPSETNGELAVMAIPKAFRDQFKSTEHKTVTEKEEIITFMVTGRGINTSAGNKEAVEWILQRLYGDLGD